MSTGKTYYTIPAQLRRMENMHILFWLFKDISWCLNFKVLGVVMIIPTLSVAIYITIKNKEYISELAHNLAVIFWIAANSTWMIFEFTGYDEVEIFHGFDGRHIALIPFGIGLIILLYYYIFIRSQDINDERTAAL